MFANRSQRNLSQPLTIHSTLHEDRETAYKIDQCRRMLLNVGADPTVRDTDRSSALSSAAGISMVVNLMPFLNNFQSSSANRSKEPLQLIWDLGASFINAEWKGDDDPTPPLHLACFGWGKGMLAKLDFLLRRGCDIHARDRRGQTVLACLIRFARYPWLSVEQKSLSLLIRKGADVHTYDNENISVSQRAYSPGSEEECRRLGDYRGDLWDAVLSECGYDIRETRKGFPRKPSYAGNYTRRDFERLWKGREAFCPYYNDPPLWDAEKGAESKLE